MKENEKFDIFLARFNSTIAPLQYPESKKISSPRRTITFRLQDELPDGLNPKKYKKFIALLRSIDDQMHHGGSSDLEDDEDDVAALILYAEAYPTDFKAALERGGRCYRCLETGHGLPNRIGEGRCWNSVRVNLG